jgi:hypothetical protein
MEIVTDITTRSSERRHIIKVGYILSSKKTIVNKNSIKFKDIIRRTERLKSSLGNIKTRNDKYLFIWMISYKDPERSSLICS